MWWPCMGEGYDPLKYETWPEEVRDFAGDVVGALRDGDLTLLARYIREGHYLEPVMAKEIADMLDSDEGYTPFRVEAVKRTKRPGGWSKWSEDRFRRMQIGVWVEAEIRTAPRGAYDGIITEACEKFGVSPTTVTNAHRSVRSDLKKSVVKPGFDLFAHYKDIYSIEKTYSVE